MPGPEPDFTRPIEMKSVETRESIEESVPLITRSLRRGQPLALNTRLALGSGETTASEALHLVGCQAGSVDVVVIVFSSITSVEAILEIGVDGENFVRYSSTVLTSEGAVRFRFDNLRARFLRLYYVATGGARGVGVLATTINGSRN